MDEIETIVITKTMLYEALHTWETQHRAGLTRTKEETAALPVETVAAESTAYLWALLAADAQ